ncbi:formyl transferase [Multifurca ochricompacta]|uniref:Formyl transferase n=1 Tax=Multifurca ochricompacta TaxID=376703 RepID=A0AAD4QN09_9AGAM|nr:formyl transferase [Multifurca ochricompacta]
MSFLFVGIPSPSRNYLPYLCTLSAPLKSLGHKLNIPVTTIPHIRPELKTWKPPSPFFPLSGPPPSNHLLLTASFGRILPSSLLSLFEPTLTLNVHPSDLPAYRGPAPIQRALLNGERETAVCVIEMKRRGGIDAGDVLGRIPLTIPSGIAYGPLRDTLAQKGGELLVSILRSILNGNEKRTPQRPLTPTTPHAPFITPIDYNLTLHPSVLLCASRFCEYHRPLSSVLVRCAQGTVLRVPMLRSEFKSLMSAKSWWDGIQQHWKDSEGCITFTNTNPLADS